MLKLDTTNIDSLFYIADKEIPLFLPKKDIIEQKEWTVCAIREDCNCLDIFDNKDYIEKTVDFFSSSNYFETCLLGLNIQEKIIHKIKNTGNIIEKIRDSIDPSLSKEYYESFAITNDNKSFLILHSHGDDITFLCGKTKFLEFQLETDELKDFMKHYWSCIKSFADFCQPFPWEIFGIKSSNYM